MLAKKGNSRYNIADAKDFSKRGRQQSTTLAQVFLCKAERRITIGLHTTFLDYRECVYYCETEAVIYAVVRQDGLSQNFRVLKSSTDVSRLGFHHSARSSYQLQGRVPGSNTVSPKIFSTVLRSSPEMTFERSSTSNNGTIYQ